MSHKKYVCAGCSELINKHPMEFCKKCQRMSFESERQIEEYYGGL